MFKSLLIFLCAYPAIAISQNSKFIIKGKVGTIDKPAKVYLEYFINKQKMLDSTAVTNGSFSITGYVNYPVQAYIYLNKRGDGIANADDKRDLYLEEGLISITAGQDSIATAAVVGTRSNQDNIAYHEMTQMYFDARTTWMVNKDHASGSLAAVKVYQQKADSLINYYSKAYNSARVNFITKNPNSFVSLKQLYNLSYFTGDSNELSQLYGKFTSNLKESIPGKELAKRLADMQQLNTGTAAPDFMLPDVNGHMIRLSSLKGKYVLLDFWASWCVPCRAENPNIIKAYQNYRNKNFTVVGISLDDKNSRSRWLQAINKDGLRWIQLSDLQGFKSGVALLYHIDGIPQNFLIGPDGIIIDRNIKGLTLQTKLKEILK